MADEKTNDTQATAENPGEGEGLVQDAQASPLAQVAAAGNDPSNTYENGVTQGNVNTVVPENAHTVTTLDEAMDAGYFGYAPGEQATELMTFAAAAERNTKLADARRAVINRSAEDEDGHTANQKRSGETDAQRRQRAASK